MLLKPPHVEIVPRTAGKPAVEEHVVCPYVPPSPYTPPTAPAPPPRQCTSIVTTNPLGQTCIVTLCIFPAVGGTYCS